MKKRDMKEFFIWMRNGIAFCVTWFLLLLILNALLTGKEVISVALLAKMIIFSCGGVFLFCICFLKGIIKKWEFTPRLTLFYTGFGCYEVICFRWIIGETRFSLMHWIGFLGILLGLYFLCIGIYQIYSNKKGKIYTEALEVYQKRSRQ